MSRDPTNAAGAREALMPKAVRPGPTPRKAKRAKGRTPAGFAGARGGDLPALCGRQSGAQGRAGIREPLHAAGGRGAVGAGHRRRRQQGDARACSRRPTRPRRWWRSAWTRCRSASRPSGSIATRPRTSSRCRRSCWPSTAARCRRSAKRWKRCRAWAARPPTWCSTSRSASRRWPSTRTCSASRTGSTSPTGKTPLDVELGLLKVIPEKYMQPRPPLAHPARPLYLPGPQAALRRLCRLRSVQFGRQVV